MSWQVDFQIFRYKQGDPRPHFETFQLTVRPDEYVLDAIERIWAELDRSLVFRHACHHAGCGACGMRINGKEKLACITRLETVASDKGTVVLEPLRNLAILSDLAVDMGPFYERMEQTGFTPVRQAEPLIDQETGRPYPTTEVRTRFEDCIECALCLSACPAAATDCAYLGPAPLAAVERMLAEPRGQLQPAALLALADATHALWRCHSAFECSQVCPTQADPAGLVMALRRRALGWRLRQVFKPARP